ncbi:MAG: GNAT family N-acetyltransferase [Candidatus Nanopelagicales bacterium]|jgi:predicted N-acetyltransferase YhbS|nr:GNAT family N-acetyltransferase [Candidatus Nanopelagicales bacterium]
MELPRGLDLRNAAPADLAQVHDLLAERGDPTDAVDLDLVVHDPDEGFASCAVVVDGDRVVSTATLLRETVWVDEVAVPAGQVELVATHPDHEGRGLVRALMDWAHEQSRQRGDLLQVMIGIPYFYRQFGYAYAVPMNRWRALTVPIVADPSLVVRPAEPADIPELVRLQEVAQSGAGVRMPHSGACWRWLLAREGSTQWAVERDGRVTGTGRSTTPDGGAALTELAADDPASALSVVAHAAGLAGGVLLVQDRPGTVAGDAVEPLLEPAHGRAEWYYARVERPGPLLEHLGPVLTRRLRDAGLGDTTHEILISSFREHVRFTIGPDGMGPVHEGGPLQAPGSRGGSGLPPDAWPTLVLGPHGATGLAESLPDCYLGGQAELMAALFPAQAADLLTFYLPV